MKNKYFISFGFKCNFQNHRKSNIFTSKNVTNDFTSKNVTTNLNAVFIDFDIG